MLPPPRLSLMVFIVMVALASLLGLVAHGDNELGFDVRVLEAIQRIDLPGLDRLVRISNATFDSAGALVFGVIYALAALLVRRPRFVVQLVVVILLRLAGQVLKPIFDSPRPPVEFQPDPGLVSSTLGYPSGHAYTASVITTMLVLLVASLSVPRWVMWVTVVIAFGMALTAMYARIAVGAHWPTDTIGGVMYGIATVALMQLVVGGFLALRARRG